MEALTEPATAVGLLHRLSLYLLPLVTKLHNFINIGPPEFISTSVSFCLLARDLKNFLSVRECA